jgi:hypothetical protein
MFQGNNYFGPQLGAFIVEKARGKCRLINQSSMQALIWVWRVIKNQMPLAGWCSNRAKGVMGDCHSLIMALYTHRRHADTRGIYIFRMQTPMCISTYARIVRLRHEQ